MPEHGEKIYLRYFLPFSFYGILVSIVASFIIYNYSDQFAYLFLGFYALLIGGYIVYFISLRLVVYQISKGEKYFHLLYHLPYLFYLIPAATASYWAIQILLRSKLLLALGFAINFAIMGLFFYWGIFLVTKTVRIKFLEYRLIHFLPLLVFLVASATISLILIPLAKDNLFFLWIAYLVALFFAIIIFILGKAITFLSFKGARISTKFSYFLPLLLYLSLALGLAFWVLPNSLGNSWLLFLGFALSLWGSCLFYFLMVTLLLNDFSKVSHAGENP